MPAATGGDIALPDQAVLRIPAGSLSGDSQVSLAGATLEDAPAIQPELAAAGNAYFVDFGGATLAQPAKLEIPFDPAQLPVDAEPGQVFVTYYDESAQQWVYAGGEVDTGRNVIVLQITHASWWMPATWNWQAWIAVLNKLLHGSIVDWIEAVRLLSDDCSQAGEFVTVDSSQSLSLVQGCIERDEAARLGLRVVNPKSFFYEVRSFSASIPPTLLAPGEELAFEVSTDDPAPLVVEAVMTQRASGYLVAHMIITMLPGANQFGIQGRLIGCLTERVADAAHFASAAEALAVEQDGVAAAESVADFMMDDEAVGRFLAAADDCGFGPAPTWSVEGLRQIGASVATIMSATDYIANYLAGNSYAEVSFTWSPPGFGPSAVWPATSDSMGLLQECYFGAVSPESVGDCVAEAMLAAGASTQAVEFARLLNGEAFMDSFTESGRVDLATIVYPGRANDNFQSVMVNGTPQIVYAEEGWRTDITQDANYPAIAQAYPAVTLWAGDNSPGGVETLPDGGQRFVFSFLLVDGCHACGEVGWARVAFDFDSAGQFLGMSLLSLES